MRIRNISRHGAPSVRIVSLTVLILSSGMIPPLLAETTAGTPPFSSSLAPWERPRDISSFQQLLKQSPFSLPTAEESSPLADRYAMTGILTIDGEEQIFLFDRTDQSRELITKKPNSKNISLVSLVREGVSNPTKASIRVGTETGTIGFMEAVQTNPDHQTKAPVSSTLGGSVAGMPALPPLPQLSSAPPPNRRIIRRAPVNAP